ncbi:MAG: hypothetical protein RIS29_2089 [Bacteroidota bacterium]|jgi:hypothetical protein
MTTKQIFKAVIDLTRTLIHNPAAIFLILKDDKLHQSLIKNKYGQDRFPTVDIRNFVTQDITVDNYTFLDGSSLITDLALLKAIATSKTDCEYLEIGTWRGESILNVAATGANCTSVNLSPEDIIKLGFNEKYAKLHACLIKNNEGITQIHANSQTFNFEQLNKKFDLIFVDGDHSYEGVNSDTRKVINLLKDDNSMIVWHDYAHNPETPRFQVVAAIMDGLPVNEHKNLYHVSNTICAVYCKKALKSQQLQSPVTPDKVFSININIADFDI